MRKNKIDYDSLTHITCHDCKEELPKSSYYAGKWSYCKQCFNKRNVKYAAKNKKSTKKETIPVKVAINVEFSDLDVSLDFNIFDTFSTIPTPEQIEADKIELEIELYKQSLLSATNIEEEVGKCIENSPKMYTVIDADEIIYNLNPNFDLTMREQIEELRLESGIIYQNRTEIGIFDGADFVWYGVDKRFVSLFSKKSQPIRKYKLTFCDNTVEIMSAREFMVKYRQSTAPRTGKHEKYSKKDNGELTEYGKIGLECVEAILSQSEQHLPS